MSWYIVVARKRRGPLSTAQLAEELQAGKVPPDAWVWTEGMEEWVPAGDVRELRPRQTAQRVVAEPPSTPRATESPQRSAGTKKRAKESAAASAQQLGGSLLLRHWRGELSLPISYWVMSTAATLIVLLLGTIVGALDISDAPRPVAIAILVFIGVAAIIVVWQVVGVWRSARNYLARGGKPIWAQLAMTLVAFAALRFVIDVVTVQAPLAIEMLQIEFASDAAALRNPARSGG